MPDITGLIWMSWPDTDGTAPHLITKHKASDKTSEDERVDARRIPSFSQERLGSDQDLDRTTLEELGHCCDHPLKAGWKAYLEIGTLIEFSDGREGQASVWDECLKFFLDTGRYDHDTTRKDCYRDRQALFLCTSANGFKVREDT